MENKNLNEVYGPATYMTQLADQFAFSTGWTSITNPSQPNYIALIEEAPSESRATATIRT